MGIQNLLPFVKKACRQGNINEFAGHSIAVDVSCLLHRGLFGCASAVAQGVETDFYIQYVTKYVKALVALNCHVILVFDGKPLPAKKDTNDARRERRDFNHRRGEQLLSEGKASEAHDFFKRSVGITSEVVEKTIEALRSFSMVDILVAPYESDAQLAFLTQTGKAYAVVTEDSDLIAFGCERIILKLDHRDGSCTIFEKASLPKCFHGSLATHFDITKFRRICILAGCDYLQSGLPGVGLNKAATFFNKANGTDLRQVLPRLPRYLNMNTLKIKKEFIEDFIRAENTFLYQIVFDPSERRQRPLNDYPKADSDGECDEEDFVGVTMTDEKKVDYSYAGEIQPSTAALRVALGNRLREGPPMADKFTLPEELSNWSIWSPDFQPGAERKRQTEENKKIEKSKCGAFMLSSFVRKVRKTSECGDEGDSVEILEEASTLQSTTVQPNNSLEIEADDDFVKITKKTKGGAVREEAHRKLTIERFFSAKSSEKPGDKSSRDELLKPKSAKKVPAGFSVRGNGAQRKWSCEELLKMYSRDRQASNSDASPESSQEFVSGKKNGVKRNAPPATDNGTAETPEKRLKAADGTEVETVQNRLENAEIVSDTVGRKSASSSSYFTNRSGIRASGLSRRTANPFKKLEVPEGRPSSPVSPPEAVEEKLEAAKDSSPSGRHLGHGSIAYRASGLRRTSAIRDT